MLTKLAFRNVFRNRRRSAITLLVIVFGAVGLILFGGYKSRHLPRPAREHHPQPAGTSADLQARLRERAEAQKPLEYGLEDVAQLRRAIERDKRVQHDHRPDHADGPDQQRRQVRDVHGHRRRAGEGQGHERAAPRRRHRPARRRARRRDPRPRPRRVDAREAGRLPDADDAPRPPARSTPSTCAWPASS